MLREFDIQILRASAAQGRIHETRLLWFFAKGQRIIVVHAIRNKGQAVPARDLETARERMRDWQKRAAK